MKQILAIIFIALQCGLSYQEEITLNCKFLRTRVADSSSSYLCMLSKLDIIIPNASGIKFDGVHTAGQGNANVEGFLVTDCNMPIINSVLTSAMYTTFPNIKHIEVFASNVQEIVPGSFAVSENSAKILSTYFFFKNVSSLADGTFDGLTGVKKFTFNSNRLVNVADALRDLKSVTNLKLQDNKFQELPKNVFKTMQFLYSVDISNNQIEILDGEIFDGNEMTQYIYISNNKIVAIGRRFFAGMYQFNDISALNNACVSGTFRYRDAAIRGLEKCFDNYDILFPAA